MIFISFHFNYEGEQLNQIVINKYTRLTHLPEHSDDEPVIRPHSNIFTITIGEKVPIVFKDSITKQEKTLEPIEGNLYVMSMESQYHWTHRMNQANLENMVRYSVTLRSVGIFFLNSTVILGNSNTKHLNFSQGQRHEKVTLGYNLPEERHSISMILMKTNVFAFKMSSSTVVLRGPGVGGLHQDFLEIDFLVVSDREE